MAEDSFNPGKALSVVLGIVGTLLCTGIIALVAMLISMGNRLSSIETVINENREVRQRQDRILDARIERIERDLYVRRSERQER